MNHLHIHIALSAIFIGIWGLMWDRSDSRNVFVKISLIGLAICGAYITYNGFKDTTAIAIYVVTVTILTGAMGIIWNSRTFVNFYLKITWFAATGTGLYFIFTQHLLG